MFIIKNCIFSTVCDNKYLPTSRLSVHIEVQYGGEPIETPHFVTSLGEKSSGTLIGRELSASQPLV